MKNNLSFVQSLYGGFWNFNIKDFNYLVNPYFPPDRFMEAIKSNLEILIRSYPSTNWYISKLCANFIGLSEDQLVIANGASELISAATQRFVKKLSIPIPTFDEYINRAGIQGKEVSLFQMDDGYSLNLKEFRSHIFESGSNSALIINPNNPTGELLSKDSIIEFLEETRQLDLVILDESFIDFSSPDVGISLQADLENYRNLLIIKSLSKSYGIPGLRLGYGITCNKEIIYKLRREIPIWSINSLAQYFLEHIDDYLEEFVESCVQIRVATEILYNGLSGISYVHPYPTQANYVFCKMLHGYTSENLVDALYSDSGILINDCKQKRGLDNRFVRIASRTAVENKLLIEAMERISAEFQINSI